MDLYTDYPERANHFGCVVRSVTDISVVVFEFFHGHSNNFYKNVGTSYH